MMELKCHIYVGNHDLWMRDYLEHEIGLKYIIKVKLLKLTD